MAFAEIQRTVDAEWKPRMHKAMSFDGVDDYVDVGTNLHVDYLTVSVWVKPAETTFSTTRAITSDWNGTDMEWQLLGLQNKRCYRFRVDVAGEYDVLDTNDFNVADTWYLITATYDGTTMKIYVNGKLNAQKTHAYGGMIKTTGNPRWIGMQPTGTSPFNCIIDEVRIYNRALTAPEIKYLYCNPFDSIDTDHLILWLNPAGIDVANGKWWDLSGNANHGTIYGATEQSLVSEEVSVQ